ncbi:hypothetical protein CCP3SC1_230022 [Gammaproteobacteria bacterium]
MNVYQQAHRYFPVMRFNLLLCFVLSMGFSESSLARSILDSSATQMLVARETRHKQPPAKSVSPEVTAFLNGPQIPTDLSATGIYPNGYQMHLGIYSPAPTPSIFVPNKTNLQRVIEGGFTVAGPFYQRDLDEKVQITREVVRQKIHVAIQIEGPSSLFKDNVSMKERPAVMSNIRDEDLRAHIGNRMSAFLSDPNIEPWISSWAATPEELRPGKPEELRYLDVFSNEVRARDRRRRPIFNYQPNNRNASALQEITRSLDIVFMGAYTSAIGWSENHAARIHWAMDQITQAAQVGQKIPMIGLQLSKDLPGFTSDTLQDSPETAERLRTLLRHDMWLSLARGAKAIQIWSMAEKRDDLTTHREQFDAYASVTQELTGQLGLQTPLLFGIPRHDVNAEVLSGPTTVQASDDEPLSKAKAADSLFVRDILGQRWPSITLANLALSGSRTLVVVNSVREPIRVGLSGIPSGLYCTDLVGGSARQAARDQNRIILNMPAFGVWVGRLNALEK